jgi:hypothetical protein
MSNTMRDLTIDELKSVSGGSYSVSGPSKTLIALSSPTCVDRTTPGGNSYTLCF